MIAFQLAINRALWYMFPRKHQFVFKRPYACKTIGKGLADREDDKEKKQQQKKIKKYMYIYISKKTQGDFYFEYIEEHVNIHKPINWYHPPNRKHSLDCQSHLLWSYWRFLKLIIEAFSSIYWVPVIQESYPANVHLNMSQTLWATYPRKRNQTALRMKTPSWK